MTTVEVDGNARTAMTLDEFKAAIDNADAVRKAVDAVYGDEKTIAAATTDKLYKNMAYANAVALKKALLAAESEATAADTSALPYSVADCATAGAVDIGAVTDGQTYNPATSARIVKDGTKCYVNKADLTLSADGSAGNVESSLVFTVGTGSSSYTVTLTVTGKIEAGSLSTVKYDTIDVAITEPGA